MIKRIDILKRKDSLARQIKKVHRQIDELPNKLSVFEEREGIKMSKAEQELRDKLNKLMDERKLIDYALHGYDDLTTRNWSTLKDATKQ